MPNAAFYLGLPGSRWHEMAAGLALVERYATDVNFPSCQTGRVGEAQRISGDASNQAAIRTARADCGFGSRCRFRHGGVIGAFETVYLAGDCKRILPPSAPLPLSMHKSSAEPDAAKRARSLTSPTNCSMPSPARSGGCYGFTECLLFRSRKNIGSFVNIR